MDNKTKKDRFSIESLILGLTAALSFIVFFLLIPGKPFGINIIEPISVEEEFTRYVLILFLIMLFGVTAIGTSVVAIVTGIKDFRGINRGLYIEKGKGVYLAGIVLGVISLVLLIGFLIALSIL